jgi:hypothetical protein
LFFFIQLIGMLMHRMMTLGHIVATTSVRLNFLKKRKQFDGDNFLNKNGVQMIKNIAKSYKVVAPHFQCLFSLLYLCSNRNKNFVKSN